MDVHAGTFMETSWKVHGNFMESSGPGKVMENHGNVMETSWKVLESSFRLPGKLMESLWKLPGMFLERKD